MELRRNTKHIPSYRWRNPDKLSTSWCKFVFHQQYPYHLCMVYFLIFTIIHHKNQLNVGKYTIHWWYDMTMTACLFFSFQDLSPTGANPQLERVKKAGEVWIYSWEFEGTVPPPNATRTPGNKALWSGRMNHWFPLTFGRLLNPYFWRGTLGGGRLICHDPCKTIAGACLLSHLVSS